MEFYVSLIKVDKSKLTHNENIMLSVNCFHITKDYYTFEGDLEFIEIDDKNYELIEEDIIVPGLGGLSEKELVKLINECSCMKKAIPSRRIK